MTTQYYRVGDRTVSSLRGARIAYEEARSSGQHLTVLKIVTVDVTSEFMAHQDAVDSQFVAGWPGGQEEAIAILQSKHPYRKEL